MCSSRKYPFPLPTEGTFTLDPHPPEFPLFFNLVKDALERIFCQKCCARYYYANDNFSCNKIRKNLFIYVNTVTNVLKDVLN